MRLVLFSTMHEHLNRCLNGICWLFGVFKALVSAEVKAQELAEKKDFWKNLFQKFMTVVVELRGHFLTHVLASSWKLTYLAFQYARVLKLNECETSSVQTYLYF